MRPGGQKPGGTHFLLYWQPRWMGYVIERNQPLARIGSYHFERLSAGDTVWVVSAVCGSLYLFARIETAEVLPRRAASKKAGEELSGRFYAFAKKGTARKARKIDITPLTTRLRFASARDRLDPANPRLWPMQLQTMRKLTPASARLLEQVWPVQPNATIAACPTGFSQEETIKAIWAEDGKK